MFSRNTTLNKKTIKALAKRTGITPRTVRSLLESGWIYEEKLNCIPHWVKPLSRLTKD